MKTRSGQKIKLTSVEELLGVPNEEVATEIDLVQIRSFKNHPFKVIDDEKMQDLMDSIKENGILTPVLVRPISNNLYEMISGHRRMHAASMLKMDVIPAIIRELSDEEAILKMVDSNIQREELLPSEKAFAYKMKLEAMKKQGSRSDLTSDQNGRKLESAYVISEQVGESKTQVRRFIRLTELIPELLDFVDRKKINFTIAVDISYLEQEIQKWLFNYICANGAITPAQIRALRKQCEAGAMTQKKMVFILNDCIRPKTVSRKVTLSEKKLSQYFDEQYTTEEMERILFELLEQWKERRKE